jgi:hypothetical protein
MKNKMKKAQGVVESVVAVGILMMVLTGTVLLINFGLSNRRSGFDRRKANELATLVMEGEVNKSINNPEEFWKLNDVSAPQKKSEFGGYFYTLDYSPISSDPKYPNCVDLPRINCAEVVVNIGWSGRVNQNLKFDRFFSR